MTYKSALTEFRHKRNGMTLEEFGSLFLPALDKSTISRWERYGVPIERVPIVEKVTGLSRHELRPDFFGPNPLQAAE